jgi:hypothetical protein
MSSGAPNPKNRGLYRMRIWTFSLTKTRILGAAPNLAHLSQLLAVLPLAPAISSTKICHLSTCGGKPTTAVAGNPTGVQEPPTGNIFKGYDRWRSLLVHQHFDPKRSQANLLPKAVA